MQNVARGVGLSGLAAIILACAVAAPAVAVEVPPPKVPVPEVHITPPQITPPKIAPPKIAVPQPQVQTPTQPTVKGNAPLGGGTTTGGGVKVDTGEANQPAPPSGGTTIGGAPIVDLKTLLPALQQATPPGGGTSTDVSVSLEKLRNLLQQSKAGQASPPAGCPPNATCIDPAQIQSVIAILAQIAPAFNSIVEQAISGKEPARPVQFYYDLPSTGPQGFSICAIWQTCSTHTTCVESVSCGGSGCADDCTTVETCSPQLHCIGW
jgi:hypothetical protein